MRWIDLAADEDVKTAVDLVERIFACQHKLVSDLWRCGAEEEWSPVEVFFLRVLARNHGAVSVADIKRILGISFQHAARISKSLLEREFVAVHSWRQFRSLTITTQGREWLVREHQCLDAYAADVVKAIRAEERPTLLRLLGQLKARLERE